MCSAVSRFYLSYESIKLCVLPAPFAAWAELIVAEMPHVTQRWVATREQRARHKVGYVCSEKNYHPYNYLTQSVHGYLRNGGIFDWYSFALITFMPSDSSAWKYEEYRIERESEHSGNILRMSAKQCAEYCYRLYSHIDELQ